MKVVDVVDGLISMYCPACEVKHIVSVDSSVTPCWAFNGNYEKPTLSPSLLVKGYNNDKAHDMICHSFIKDGKWIFLPDCSHELAGKTVDITLDPDD